MTKFNSNCDKTKKLKFLQFKNSNCDKTQSSYCENTKKLKL